MIPLTKLSWLINLLFNNGFNWVKHVFRLFDSISVIFSIAWLAHAALIILWIGNLFKQVKKAGCIGEDHDIAEEGGSDEPNLLKPGEIVILIFDLLDSNHCLNHIETNCIDGVH